MAAVADSEHGGEVHVLLLPYPSQGHINPILQFGKRLASYGGVRCTLAVTRYLLGQGRDPSPGAVHLAEISDGYDGGGFAEAAGDVAAYLARLESVGSRTVDELLQSEAAQGRPVRAVVYDAFLQQWAPGVARRRTRTTTSPGTGPAPPRCRSSGTTRSPPTPRYGSSSPPGSRAATPDSRSAPPTSTAAPPTLVHGHRGTAVPRSHPLKGLPLPPPALLAVFCVEGVASRGAFVSGGMDEHDGAGYAGGGGSGSGAVRELVLMQQERRRRREEEEAEVRRQMFGHAVADRVAFQAAAAAAALGQHQHQQQAVEYGELGAGGGAGFVYESEAGGSSEPEPHDRPRGVSGSKRTRAAEVHNLSEKRRRNKINEKMKALQSLIPNSNKTDKASMLDEAIEYLKQLQLQVQVSR